MANNELFLEVKTAIDQGNLNRAEKSIERLTKQSKAYRAALDSLVTVQGANSRETKEAELLVKRTNKALQQAVREYRQLANAQEENTDEALSYNSTLAKTDKEIKGNVQALRRYRASLDAVGEKQGQLSTAQRRTNAGLNNTSKAANNANQILFSFGDAIQDGAQFQFGFAEGARAVGNNLTFAAEQIAVASRNAGSFKAGLAEIGGAILGPAGVILAINAIVTAITVFSQRAQKAKKATEELTDAAKEFLGISEDVASELAERGLFGEDEFDIKQLQFRKRFLEDESLRLQEEAQAINDRLSELQSRADDEKKRIAEIDSELASIRARTRGQETDRTKELEAEKSRLTSAKELDSLLARRAELAELITDIQSKIPEIVKDISLARREELAVTEEIRKEVERIQSGETISLESVRGIPTPEELLPDFATTLTRDIEVNDRRVGGIQSLRQLNEEKAALEQQFLDATTQAEAEAAARRISIKEQEIAARKKLLEEDKKNTEVNLQSIAQISSQIISGIFGQSKAAAIATAIIDASVAFNKALSSAPPPFNYALAAGVAASALKQINTIKNTDIGSESSGGVSSAGTQQTSSAFITRSGERTNPSLEAATSMRNIREYRPNFVIEQKIKNKELAILVREGNNNIRASQVKVN